MVFGKQCGVGKKKKTSCVESSSDQKRNVKRKITRRCTARDEAAISNTAAVRAPEESESAPAAQEAAINDDQLLSPRLVREQRPATRNPSTSKTVEITPSEYFDEDNCNSEDDDDDSVVVEDAELDGDNNSEDDDDDSVVVEDTVLASRADDIVRSDMIENNSTTHPLRHQPLPMLMNGSGRYCQYKKCPGLESKKAKRVRPYKTIYRCEECSMETGKFVWLCNTTKRIDGKMQVVCCHRKYHKDKYKMKTTGTTECSVGSDLTEELINL